MFQKAWKLSLNLKIHGKPHSTAILIIKWIVLNELKPLLESFPEFFNQMTTNHGLIMVFGVIMPAFVGLANWMIPMQIGAPDMALPRLNNLSFWLLPMAFGILLSTLLVIVVISCLFYLLKIIKQQKQIAEVKNDFIN